MVCHLEAEHGQLKIESRAQDIRSKHEPSATPLEVQHLSFVRSTGVGAANLARGIYKT